MDDRRTPATADNFGEQGGAGGKHGGESPENDSTALAMERVRQGYEWISQFPQAWERVQELAADEYEHGRISMQHIWEEIRMKEWVAADGSDFKLNNNLRSVLVRILVKENPHYRERVEMRCSLVDGML